SSSNFPVKVPAHHRVPGVGRSATWTSRPRSATGAGSRAYASHSDAVAGFDAVTSSLSRIEPVTPVRAGTTNETVNVVDGAPVVGLTWGRIPAAAPALAVASTRAIAAAVTGRGTVSRYRVQCPGAVRLPGSCIGQLPQFGLSMTPLASVPKKRGVGTPYWLAPANELAPLVTCPNSHSQAPETRPCERKG